MIVLKILAVIALVIIALLALNLTFIIAYENEFSFSIKVLFFRFKLFPKKKKKIKPGDYSPEAIEKRKKKEEAKKAKKEEKKKKKAEKKKKKNKKDKEENKEGGAPGKKKKTDIPALINMIKNIASAVFERFPKYLKVNIKKLHLKVGTDDAAKTATTYGAVTAALPILLEFINCHAKLKQYKKDAISVVPDFVSGQSDAQVDIRISIRVISAVIIGIAALRAFLKSKDEQKEKELRKQAFEKRVAELVEKWEKENAGEAGDNTPAETAKDNKEEIKEEKDGDISE